MSVEKEFVSPVFLLSADIQAGPPLQTYVSKILGKIWSTAPQNPSRVLRYPNVLPQLICLFIQKTTKTIFHFLFGLRAKKNPLSSKNRGVFLTNCSHCPYLLTHHLDITSSNSFHTAVELLLLLQV